MSILTRAGDLVYTFRFLKLLVTPFVETQAYQLGIIDGDGNKRRDYPMNSAQARSDYRTHYSPFHRLVFNIKQLINATSLGARRTASYASALYLIKERYGVDLKYIQDNGVSFDLERPLRESSDPIIPGRLYRISADLTAFDTNGGLQVPQDSVVHLERELPCVLGIAMVECTDQQTGRTFAIPRDILSGIVEDAPAVNTASVGVTASDVSNIGPRNKRNRYPVTRRYIEVLGRRRKQIR